MELTAPRGPCPDEGINAYVKITGMAGENGGTVETVLDSLVGLLVQNGAPNCTSELTELHTEVQFCLWSMHISLAVYMKLLSLVDISVRQEVSDTIGQFLAGWRTGRGPALSDALDALIIKKFRKHSITDIPDMAKLQRIKECHSISSTVANYIKDIAVRLDSIRQSDLESTIDVLFPLTKLFIGRCFFPRLAAVASKLLDQIKPDLDSENSRNSTLPLD